MSSVARRTGMRRMLTGFGVLGAAGTLSLGILGLNPLRAGAAPMADDALKSPQVGQPAAVDTDFIPLRNGPVASTRLAAALNVRTVRDALAAGQARVVLQFDRPMTDDVRNRLLTSGIELQSYLSRNAFIASVNSGLFADNAFDLVPTLLQAHALQPDWKLHPTIQAGEVMSWAIVRAGFTDDSSGQRGELEADELVVGVYVLFHPDVPLDAAVQRLGRDIGITVRSLLRSVNGAVIELNNDNVRGLAQRDDVLWVEPPLPRFSAVNNSNRARVQADLLQAAPYGLSGAGVNVLVYDAGFAFNHVDFQGRMTVRDTSGQSDHATHVAGTVGGGGVANPNFKGMAPGATIQSYGFEQEGGLQQGFLYSDPGDIEDDYSEAIGVHGVDIANNSIGTNTAPNGFPCEWEGDYSVTDALIDSIVRGGVSGGVPFRIVWANGNERQTTRCTNTNPPGIGQYHSTAPPACAKNHITVGALNSNDDSMTGFSSWGPTDDGRIKPDISGPGCQSNDDQGVSSTVSGGGYSSFCGTSMSSPTVCGISALMLQDYRVQFPDLDDPRNSTLKILLAHTAVDLGNPGPDYQFGYGSVRAKDAIDFMRTGNFTESSVAQGETYRAIVVVPPGTAQLKVTLAWDDPQNTPLVSQALVNDLDLRVFAPNSEQAFPWTLNPASPASPAVRTAVDRLNNIEQVVINSPVAGVYQLQVHGFNVPQGPQVFSIAASPQLVQCADAGFISLSNTDFLCNSTVGIQVVDCGLNTSNSQIETVVVSIRSTTDPVGMNVLLTETAAETAAFAGTVPLSTSAGTGVLQIAHGDTVTVRYIDADDGAGNTNVIVEQPSIVDCVAPAISNLTSETPDAHTAIITFNTDEPANVRIRWGTSCANLANTLPTTGFRTGHSLSIVDLPPNTTFYYAVDARDTAGNTTTSDNGGACHSFTLPRIPNHMTELFGSGETNDLAQKTVLFVPDGSIDFYAACSYQALSLPTDPAGGTAVTLSDDQSATVDLADGAAVLHFGNAYSRLFIGSNGYVTFGAPDTGANGTIGSHFSFRRIAALFADLDPQDLPSTISHKQLGDRIAVTWQNVPLDAGVSGNTFQIEMYFDGRIALTWLNVAIPGGLVGLSRGGGIPDDFFEADYSGFGSCGPRPPSAGGQSVNAIQGRARVIPLFASDDGTPGPLSYRIDSLPAQTLRDPGSDHVIVPADLPYTLVNGGSVVVYESAAGFNGPDSFGFRASDGGTPPTGGDSNLATVGIVITRVLELPLTDGFNGPGIDPTRWSRAALPAVNGDAANEPSPPSSLNFDGAPESGDVLESHIFDLSTRTVVQLNYAWQRRGNGDQPEAGDDLFVEFMNAGGAWTELARHPGAGPSMTSFQSEQFILPFGAYHNAFQLRIRSLGSAGSAGFDDWFIDDLNLFVPNAPAAFSAAYNVPINASLPIELEAADAAGDPLTYSVLSLPAHAQLIDEGSGQAITAVPHVLAGGGNIVRYLADSAAVGNDTITFRANDGTNDSNTATVSIKLGVAELIQAFDLNTNPGWTADGNWQFGPPQGLGSHNHDPSAAYTGVNVFGNNLAGDYANNITTTFWLTTGVIDCTGHLATELRFQRWLGVDAFIFDRVHVQASADGSAWTSLWTNGDVPIADAQWTPQTIVTPQGDDNAQLRVRWGLGTTNLSVTWPGWNIDDVAMWGVVPSIRADVDRNCAVDLADLARLLTYFGQSSGAGLAEGDVDGDADVDLADLATLLSLFGTTCP